MLKSTPQTLQTTNYAENYAKITLQTANYKLQTTLQTTLHCQQKSAQGREGCFFCPRLLVSSVSRSSLCSWSFCCCFMVAFSSSLSWAVWQQEEDLFVVAPLVSL
jgi:hypothetical protein